MLSGEWVGVTKGNKVDQTIIDKTKRYGTDNHFFNKHHTQQSKKLIGSKTTEFFNTPKGMEERTRASKRMLKIATLPKSPEHRKKIGRSMIMLKNRITLEAVRIDKEDLDKYDLTIWLNPAKISQKRLICSVCGKESIAGNIIRWHNDKCKGKK